MNKCKILHGRNGREYRLPELPRLSVDGYCPETKKVYEFCGCYYHGHTCMPYRDKATLGQDNVTHAQRYEQTIVRLDKITKAVYEVELMWECEFDMGILWKHTKLRNNPLVHHATLNTRDALYVGGTEATSLHKKIRGARNHRVLWRHVSTRTYASIEIST
jgi:G:T-mismatch repair DNA endonuclease (very short patch repair protein)